MKMEQGVPKRRHIHSRRRGITQKKAYKITDLLSVDKRRSLLGSSAVIHHCRTWPLCIQAICSNPQALLALAVAALALLTA
jgi:hypothetical protein